MTRIVEKLKQLLAGRQVQDVAPPNPDIPHELARDLQAVTRSHRGAGPRAGAPLRGSVRSPNDHDRVLVRPEERTEELLALSDDALHDPEDDGIDPYNTGTFRSTGSWSRYSGR